MSWTTPKTNWVTTDRFNPSDYNRIKDNLDYLKDLGAELYYPPFTITDMGNDKDYTSGYFASEFNVLEANLETINTHVYTRDYGDTKTFYDNQAFIDFTELNRIESATLGIYNMLTTQVSTVRRLSFTLGLGGL